MIWENWLHEQAEVRDRAGLHRTLHRRNVPRPIVDRFQGLVRAIGKPIERPKLSPAVEARMIDCFRSDVESLKAFTGKSFAEWRQY